MFSLIIPCYNELENLKFHKSKFYNFINNYKSNELIFVDNGSSDKTYNYLKTEYREFDNVKIVKIEKNVGYGNGVYNGILKSSNEYVSWIHADLQVSFDDLINGYGLVLNEDKNNLILVKGKRKNRNLFDSFFTFCMSFLTSALFLKKINDINSTPNIISKKIFNNITKIPKDFNFELFCYLLAVKSNYKVIRFDVVYTERKLGFSKWNINIFSKIKLSYSIFKYILKIRFFGIN